MSTTLRFRQHEEFQRAALRMTFAGAIAGLLAYASFQGATSPWALAMVAAAAVLGALAPLVRDRVHELAVRAGFCAMAAASLVLLSRTHGPLPAMLAFAVFFGAAIGWGLPSRKLLLALAAGAAVAVLARHVFLSIVHAQELASLPQGLLSAGAGAAFSLISVFALVPRHLELERDRVASAYDQLGGSLTGEVRELVDRGYAVWTKAKDDLPHKDANRETLEEGVMRLLEVARRWQSVEGAGTQTMASSLVERMDALQQRIDSTQDEITRGQYEQAKAALAEQLRYVKDIGTSRERVLARMHNYLAAMERLRMAVINLESTQASQDAGVVQPLITNLEQLGADMDSCSEALLEAERLAAK